MSQPSVPRIGFIGAGRIARCLAPGFTRAGYSVTAIASRTPLSARQLASQIESCAAYDDPQRVVESADILFLTVPDDSIGTTANTPRVETTVTPQKGAWALVHCSGASPVDLLAPAHDQSASIGGFHPLYLFGDDLTDVDRIAGCSLTIEADGAPKAVLVGLAGALRCRPPAVDTLRRTHALSRRRALRRQFCVMQSG